ncbi:EpsG family protein [Flavobacterium daemonense]|uniref:EpsG family protein n=1 Tax=Flavobacterium daemonense TaxID=1393049 RepID=UPI0011859018|nr:EpsG family protein [Flavobacterium daemonense]KAF2333148.1 hypothetical protein FND99_10960 [Flavobacterium daemonense]
MSESFTVYSKKSLKEFGISLVLYLILPFSSLVISFVLYRKKWAKYLFVLFGLYFGFTFIIPSSKVNLPSDSEFYAMELQNYHINPISFKELVNGFYSVDTLQSDIYQPLVTWCVSAFTDDPHVLFAVFGLVFSFFLGKIIWLMIDISAVKLAGFASYLLLTFVLLNPLWNINGVRMWTGLNVFLLGVIMFYFKNKPKGFILILCSCLVHVSFTIPIVFFIIYQFVSKININYFFVLFIVSFLFKGLPPSLLNTVTDFFPEFVKYKLDFYTDPNTVALVAEENKDTSLFILASQFSQSFVPFLIICYMFFSYKKEIIRNESFLLFYKFLLFNVLWINMSAIIPSFGRFLTIFLILSMFFFFINLNQLMKLPYFNTLKLILLPFLSIIIVQKLREFIDFQSVFIFVGNFITSSFVSEPTPLVNVLLK